MSITSTSLSCEIRAPRSGGTSGGGATVGAGCRGGVQSTFGAGAVPATPRTPGVPQPVSSAAVAVTSVPSRNFLPMEGRGRRTSGWCVSIRSRIRLSVKGWRLDRASRDYTHGPGGAWSLAKEVLVSGVERVRLDRWLWAARFFKTRALAAAAVAGGKVELNGARAKRAKPLAVGDRSEEHTSELQSLAYLVCRLLLEK